MLASLSPDNWSAGEEHKWKSPVKSLSLCVSDRWSVEGIILYPSQYSPGSSSVIPSSSFHHMTSARLSLTLFLCLVLALKAAELKRCCWRRKDKKMSATLFIIFRLSSHMMSFLFILWHLFQCAGWDSRTEEVPLPFQIERSCSLWQWRPGWGEHQGQKCLLEVGWTAPKQKHTKN